MSGINDAHPLARVIAILSGLVAGAGAFAWQWALRNPGTDVGVIVAGLVMVASRIALGLGAALAIVAVIMARRSLERIFQLPLYIVAAFFVTLYALGGRWPFWLR